MNCGIFFTQKNKCWIWKAYDRGERRCVAWVVGRRDHATLGRLWERIARPECLYYTGEWAVYPDVIPIEQHIVSKAGTHLMESNNANTRHRVARFTRRTKVVSKSATMVDLTIRLWAYFEHHKNFAAFQEAFLSILS
jgi:insertion element IS1 protein InsB